ncbi:MAG: putative DNA binding domain-containing protein [Leptolyngbya sp. SIO1E4]|nr:putative DNA binding domain-containing protein [Leptolyngbya sp. SIO1E4]
MRNSYLILNSIFKEEENKNNEFKKLDSKRPSNRIINHAEQYIVCFLNASVSGNLYIGIDDDGKVVGVSLSREERDRISRQIPEKLRSLRPSILPSFYDVNFIKIFNSNKSVISDLVVIHIHVRKIEEEDLYLTSEGDHWLYKTSGGSAYLKAGSACMKLTKDEVPREIRRRKLKYCQRELEKIEKEICANPNDKKLLRRKIEIAKLMGDVETVEEAFNCLLSISPTSTQTTVEHASTLQSLGNIEGALQILNNALIENTNSPKILKSKGSIMLGLDKADEALEIYQEALKLSPEDYTIITQIGIILRDIGKYGEAIKFFNFALSISPRYRAAKYEREKTYSKLYTGLV